MTTQPKRPGGLLAYRLDDGGRAAAGFKGTTGDCVTRAIAIATGRPYADVYAALNEAAKVERPGARARKQKGKRSSARTGIFKPTIRRYMESIGWVWVPTMQIGSGCKVHLRADELPPGRLVVNVSRHSVAVLDGVAHDTHDCTRDGKRCVYGYYQKRKITFGPGGYIGPPPEGLFTNHTTGQTFHDNGDGSATLIPKPTTPTPFDEALAKVRADLDWRGPTKRKAGHIVLSREHAAALIGYEEREP